MKKKAPKTTPSSFIHVETTTIVILSNKLLRKGSQYNRFLDFLDKVSIFALSRLTFQADPGALSFGVLQQSFDFLDIAHLIFTQLGMMDMFNKDIDTLE